MANFSPYAFNNSQSDSAPPGFGTPADPSPSMEKKPYGVKNYRMSPAQWCVPIKNIIQIYLCDKCMQTIKCTSGLPHVIQVCCNNCIRYNFSARFPHDRPLAPYTPPPPSAPPESMSDH